MDKDNIAVALHSITNGRYSLTNEPVKVVFNNEGFILIDGYHRILEQILNGKTTALAHVEIDNNNYTTPVHKRYVFDPDDPFYNLEQFTTRKILRSIMK